MNEQKRLRIQRSLDRVLESLRADPQVSLVQLFGSARGEDVTEHSDIDLYVVTDERAHWRASREVEGVEVEMLFCPLPALHKRLTTYNALALQAFATGETLLDRNGKAAELVALARKLYERGAPPVKPVLLDAHRGTLTRIIQKLERLPADSPEARFLAGDGIQRAVTLFYHHHRLWIRGLRHSVSDMRARDPGTAELLVRYLQDGHPARAVAFLEAVIAPLGGHLLEYETEKTPC